MYTVKTKYLNQPNTGLKGICIFLADEDYNEKDMYSEDHRTKALAWYCCAKDIRKDISDRDGDVDSILNWYKNSINCLYGHIINELYMVSTYTQVQFMIKQLEDYIRQTILEINGN